MTFNYQRPVYVDGNTVVVYLPSKPLTYSQTYYVNVAFGDETGSLGKQNIDKAKELRGMLVALKDKFDPKNLFRVNQNIKPA